VTLLNIKRSIDGALSAYDCGIGFADVVGCIAHDAAAAIYRIRSIRIHHFTLVTSVPDFKHLAELLGWPSLSGIHFSNTKMLSNKPLVFSSSSRISCKIVLGSRSGASSARFGFFALRS